jgi:tRNA pseudouridine38-40 synthase
LLNADSSERTLKLTVAYDGTGLVGWQRQAAGVSVQGLLEAALARIDGAPVAVHGAGRTDAGVHALGQVASAAVRCRHDVETLRRALNAGLPAGVRVRSVEEAPPGFHARFSARFKTYRYLLSIAPVANPFERAYVWHLAEPLDVTSMQAAAGAFVGTHDFAAFRSTGSGVETTVRTVTRSELTVSRMHAPAGGPEQEQWGAMLVYEIAGNGFLRHMVRAITGTLVDVGRGRWPAGRVPALLASGDRAMTGATAPAHGLFLVRVDYH